MYFSSLSLFPILALVKFSIADFNILLLHTNDMHARFQQADRYLGMCENDNTTTCFGGFARLKTEAENRKNKAAAAGRPTIFLNAGDSFQGTPFYTFFKWPIVSQFVSMLGIDVMSLGNHEFDDGVSDLAKYISNVTVPNICSNLILTQEPSLVQPNLTPSYILNVNNVKIGVIGYLTPDTKFLSNIGKVQILDEIPSIRKEAQRLLGMNINILIAVGHSGYLVDQQIAKEVEEIDLVVGGHSHTFLYSGTPPDPVDIPRGPYPTVVTQASGKKVPVVQAYYGTKYLGYLELDFDDNGNLKNWAGLPILLSGDLPQDPQVLAALEPYEKQLQGKITKIVGYSEVLLDSEDLACKTGECNIGNLIADAYVDYPPGGAYILKNAAGTNNSGIEDVGNRGQGKGFDDESGIKDVYIKVTRNFNATQGWTQAAIGIVQAGGVRASINTKTNINHNGSITLGDVITAMPWGGKVVVKDLLGSVLLEALEFSVHRYEVTNTAHVNEFLQVSGLQVVYNMGASTGHRVVSVHVRCASCELPTYAPLNTSETYGVAMPEYIATGGDGFSMFTSTPNSYIFDDIDYMVLAKYITLHSPVYPTVEGRITIKGNSSSAASTLATSWIILHAVTLLCLTRL